MRGFILAILALLAATGFGQIPQWTLTPNAGGTGNDKRFPLVAYAKQGNFYTYYVGAAQGTVERRSADGAVVWSVSYDNIRQVEVDNAGNAILLEYGPGTNSVRRIVGLAFDSGSQLYATNLAPTMVGNGRDTQWMDYDSSTDQVVCLTSYDGTAANPVKSFIVVVSNQNGTVVRAAPLPSPGQDEPREIEIAGAYAFVGSYDPGVAPPNRPRIIKYRVSDLGIEWDRTVPDVTVSITGTDYFSFGIVPDDNGGCYYACDGNGNDVVVCRFDATGNYLWFRSFGDAGADDFFQDVCLSQNRPVIACKIVREGQSTLSAIKLNDDGTTAWSRYLAATPTDYRTTARIKADPASNVYVAGRVRLSDAGYREDAFAVKLGPDGVGAWAYTYNSPANVNDQYRDISISPTGALLCIGYNEEAMPKCLITKLLSAQMTFNPTTVVGGVPSTGTITLNEGAPVGGANFALSETSPNVTAPASVNIAGGATSATFAASTLPVSTTVGVTVTGKNGLAVARGRLSILAPAPSTVTVVPSSILGGQSGVGTVQLTGNTAAGGASCSLYENSPALSVYPSAFVPAGSSGGSFMVFTNPVASDTPATISASLNGTTKSTTVTVLRPALLAVSTVGSSIVGGDTLVGNVYVSGKAPTGGVTVSMSDNSSSLTAPPSVLIPADEKSASFNAITVPVTSNRVVTITAVYGGTTKTTTVTVTPPRHSVYIAPDVLTGGTTGTGMVILSHPAPTGGVTVVLSTGAPSLVGLPASVFIPAGGSSRMFTFTTNTVASNTTVAIFGTYNGSSQRKDIVLVP